MSDINDEDAAHFFESASTGGVFPQQTIAQELLAGWGNSRGTIFPTSLQNAPVPPREWLVEDWIPRGSVTGLYGDGGVGKSLLAMMLMTCVSQGYPFLNLPTAQTKTFGFFCEDSEDELHRRQNDINHHYGCDFIHLEKMAWQSRVGKDNLLMTFDKGIGKYTETYSLMKEEIQDIGASFVIIDTAADTFGGNENARPEVRQYINLLGQLAIDIQGTVLLCAHPSRSGLADETGSGGSTAWNNTLRSRLYLRRPKLKDGDEASEGDAKGIRELEKMKSNYSSVGDKITLRWASGAFQIEGEMGYDIVEKIQKEKSQRDDEYTFLGLLDEFNKSGRTCSPLRGTRNFAPNVLRNKSISAARLEGAMNRLFDKKLIRVGTVCIGEDRHKKEGLIRV